MTKSVDKLREVMGRGGPGRGETKGKVEEKNKEKEGKGFEDEKNREKRKGVKDRKGKLRWAGAGLRRRDTPKKRKQGEEGG